MTEIAIIPLRKGSKGVPGKNTRCLAGIPLFQHSVSCAKDAGIGRIIITTDIDQLPSANSNAFELFRRSPATATDSAPTHSALIEVIEHLKLRDETIVLLQATSPLRRAETVQRATSLFHKKRFDLVCSAREIDNSVLKSGTLEGDRYIPVQDAPSLFQPRQKLPALYKLDGGVFVFNSDWLQDNKSLVTDNIGIVLSPSEDVVDIDTPADFLEAEKIFQSRNLQT